MVVVNDGSTDQGHSDLGLPKSVAGLGETVPAPATSQTFSAPRGTPQKRDPADNSGRRESRWPYPRQD
ncbi:hypothetical protein [Paenibacillus rubinfantis]|uniref:hypothetical protein n=1 Tax=Paenibacillus rubinfantis TaxID=1720296 RepID=UPI0011DD0288|nr:hypothetical protein [Paenibacillus rubinfantis]